MSRSPYFYLEVYNSNRKEWENVAPLVWNYKHDKMVPADLFPYNGCHDLFEGLDDRNSEYHIYGVHNGLPKDASDEVRKEVEEFNEANKDIHFTAPVKWVSYADMYATYLKTPKVQDYYSETNEKTTHPVKTLMNRVDAFMEVWDDFFEINENMSFLRVIFWVV